MLYKKYILLNFPRVLIFGQPFNNRQGGGITLSNLFKGWDKDKIAVAATGHVMSGVTMEICDTYYQLGSDEYIWKFPFNHIQRKFQSGPIKFNNNQHSSPFVKKSRLRHILVNKYFYPALKWLGLFHNAAEIRLTDRFRKWLLEFKPEIIYLQVYSFDTVKFARVLIDILKVPSIIHMMDDWPSTISSRGPFKEYWFKKIDREFRTLLSEVDLFLSIGEAMSEEYQKRYGKGFIPFHNPIDIFHWEQNKKASYDIDESNIKILYSGRIGMGISRSLIEIAEAIEFLNRSGFKTKFHIQSPVTNPGIIEKLLQYKCIVINSFAEYSALPGIFSRADILVIANDFDTVGISFLRYSMPTKASEYMMSGTPVLVYSHYDTAVSRFFSTYGCGHCVTEHNPDTLLNAIKELIFNEEYRANLGTNAVKIASKLFDGDKIREEFRQLIWKTVQQQD
jgi:glycosyltransferase involved in cell wall biosynthesis